jgi:hypothetical protein
VNDEAVLQRALEDQDATTARIEELRAQIAQQELHLADVEQFIEVYRRYAAIEPATPAVPAFAYSAD